MCVVGHNPGEKRKQEHLQDAERISQREAAERESLDTAKTVAEESALTQPSGDKVENIEIDAEGLRATPTPVQTGPVQKSYAKRNDMLDHLEAQAAKQAAAVRQRSSPYGHG